MYRTAPLPSNKELSGLKWPVIKVEFENRAQDCEDQVGKDVPRVAVAWKAVWALEQERKYQA